MTTITSKMNNAVGDWVPHRISAETSGAIIAILSFMFLGSFSALGYTSLGGNVYASNGSDSDTQAAINAAVAGGTVQVPNGNFTWASGINCNKAIKIMGASAGGVTINNNQTNGPLVSLTPAAGGSIEFCNFIFKDGPAQSNKSNQHDLSVGNASGTRPVLVHDCTFTSNGSMLSQVLWSQNGGVIWNCVFDANFSNDECIQLKNPTTDTWRTPSTMGTADSNGTANTYIEDCTFQHSTIETVDCDDGSRAVIRHNTFNNGCIVSHGQDTSPFGNRHWEIYNNTFIFTTGTSSNPGPNQFPLNLQGFMLMRGGTGIIANNTVPNITSTAWGDKGEIAFASFSITQTRCYSNYPIPRQVGQGWSGGSGSYSYAQEPSDGSGYVTDPVYIWGNTGGGNYGNPGTWDFTPDKCGHGLTSADVIRAGRDYIVNTAKPGYTPYAYPHPLRTGSPAAPVAPQNLRTTSLGLLETGLAVVKVGL
jgi:hypothetical protein